MPIYEYSCRDCEQQFEVLVRGGETPHCPHCQSEALTKELSAFARPGGAGESASGGHCCGGSCGCH